MTKLKTGIRELDKLIGGGIESGSRNILYGPPGTGKTVFAMQFLWQGLQEGETVAFDVMLLPYSPITNPLQVVLEYPIAFGMLGLAGLFHKKSTVLAIVGVGLSVFIKFLLHFIAGIIFWAYTVPTGWDPAVYSAVYNGSFLFPEFIISGILIFILVKTGTLEYGL